MKALMIPTLAKKKDSVCVYKQKSAALAWMVRVTNWIQDSLSGVRSLTHYRHQWLEATLYPQKLYWSM